VARPEVTGRKLTKLDAPEGTACHRHVSGRARQAEQSRRRTRSSIAGAAIGPKIDVVVRSPRSTPATIAAMPGWSALKWRLRTRLCSPNSHQSICVSSRIYCNLASIASNVVEALAAMELLASAASTRIFPRVATRVTQSLTGIAAISSASFGCVAEIFRFGSILAGCPGGDCSR
jgi:hypothetical protein